MSIGKWKAFKKCVDDAGAIIQARKDDTCACYDWFQARAENQFTKSKVWQYLDDTSKQSEYTRLYVMEHQKIDDTRKDYQSTLQPVTWAILMEEIHKNELCQRPYAIVGLCLKFARTASKEKLVDFAQYIEAENYNVVTTQMLRVFRKVDYPLNRAFLMELAHSRDLELRKAAISALGRFQDEKIHKLAVELLESGDTESGLALLIKNWKKSDDPLIRMMVMKSQRISHALQMDLREIYLQHRSTSCGEVLMHAYRNGDCSFCRSTIVEAMGKNGVLPDRILVACQYDSYDETRAYAKKLMKRRGLVVGEKDG